MDKLTQRHENRMKLIRRINRWRKYKDEERKALKGDKSERKKIAASKLIMAAMLLICTEIIIFAEWAMYRLGDMSALYALIGIPATLAISIWSYCAKTAKENSVGGIVYETAMFDKRQESQDEEGEVENECIE